MLANTQLLYCDIFIAFDSEDSTIGSAVLLGQIEGRTIRI